MVMSNHPDPWSEELCTRAVLRKVQNLRHSLGEGENLSERTDDRDLAAATPKARPDLDPLDWPPNDIDRLSAGLLVL